MGWEGGSDALKMVKVSSLRFLGRGLHQACLKLECL